MDLSMPKEKSDSLTRTGIIAGTSVTASDFPNFVRKLNKGGEVLELFRGGFGNLEGPKTGSYWEQN